LDRSPRFLDAKGAKMLGLMFMAKEGKSDAPMLKIKSSVQEDLVHVLSAIVECLDDYL
jgi:hypothetical protein